MDLKNLEKRLIEVDRNPQSDGNRLKFREIIIQIYEKLKSTKDIKSYTQIEGLLDTARSMLRIKYQDYVTLDFLTLPEHKN